VRAAVIVITVTSLFDKKHREGSVNASVDLSSTSLLLDDVVLQVVRLKLKKKIYLKIRL
jgi:hypothetical protein